MSKPTLGIKSFEGFEIKDAAKGEVRAVVATLGVVDKDEDVITKGAIQDGARVVMSDYGHSARWGARPVGQGVIRIEGNKAIFDGRIFLKTSEGRETFTVLEEMGPDQQWSFGFRIKGAEVPDEEMRKQGARRILTKLEALEVSPVMEGAGLNTRTVSVKGKDEHGNDVLELDREEEEKAIDPAIAEAEKQVAAINESAARMFSRRPHLHR